MKSYINLNEFVNFKTSSQNLFFKDINVELNKDKITVNYGDDWINLKTIQFIEFTEYNNRKIIESVKAYYFDRLDDKRKKILN